LQAQILSGSSLLCNWLHFLQETGIHVENKASHRDIVGPPSEPGPYTIRVKAPHGEKLMPHKHPEDRVYTVISGVFYIRLGDEFDASKLEAYLPGAVNILPGNTPHFHWAKSGEYVTQVTATGPAWTGIPQRERRHNNS
jgi:quercetin dioxygenase-like cupin family protein